VRYVYIVRDYLIDMRDDLESGHVLFVFCRDIGADYYVTNAHKWFCSCKVCIAPDKT